MAGKFELKVAKNGDYHFNLLASNGQIIMSSEMYKSKASAENGIASIKKNSGSDANFERLVSSNGKPYFVLKAANHQVIGQSQMYESEASRDNGIASVMKNAPDAETVDLTA
ncbi:MAG: YegP family protein [Methylophilaceae bacterium]|nr:YegP family protein [Methylophilaceae bacterium]